MLAGHLQFQLRSGPRRGGARPALASFRSGVTLLLPLALVVAAAAGAQPFVTRVSVSSAGAQGDAASAWASLSADGRYVAFFSASSLVPDDTNSSMDVFVRDRQAATTTRVSLSTGGAQGDCSSTFPSINATGRFVAFDSCASNLVPDDTNSTTDVFLRDRDTDADGVFDEPGAVSTTRVSLATDGTQGNRGSTVSKPSAVSADGRYVLFDSQSTTLAPGLADYHVNVFVRDTVLGTTTRLSVATDGTQGNFDSGLATISSSGRFVAFMSGASNLVPADTNDRNDCSGAYAWPLSGPVDDVDPLHNCHDVFVRDRDTDNDGIFDEPNAVATTRVSVASDGTQANDMSGVAAISGDGRYVAFHSWATNLAAGSPNALDSLFIHDRQTGTTTRLATVGVGPNHEEGLFGVDIGLSADAQTILFSSLASDLVTGDTNGLSDLFVLNRGSGAIKRVSLSHDGEEGYEESRFGALSSDGSVVAWTSAAPNLAPGDTNRDFDVFAGLIAAIAAKDADADGLPDSWETRYGLDAGAAEGPNGPNGDPDGDGVTNANELAVASHPRGFVTRYLAEGATIDQFDTQLALLNAGETAALVNVKYLTGSGTQLSHALTIPPRTRKTIEAWREPGLDDAEFSTVVESDVMVVVDRTMLWSQYSSHSETAVTAPSLTWYLAEGATHSGFDLFYLLQNPNAAAADVEVSFLRPSGAPLVRQYNVAPGSRFNIWVDTEPGLDNTDVSAVVRVTNGQPIIVERAMYLSRPGEPFLAAHESAGVTAPATTWFLAEGATGNYFDLFVLIANPGASDAQVRATYLLQDGSTLQKLYTVPGNSRYNIWVDFEEPALADTAVSTTIESVNGVPIIVERAMWWPGSLRTWQEAHNSPGATTTGTLWAMAEGEVEAIPDSEPDYSRHTDTFILIANTSTNAASARVTLLFEDGSSAERTFAVAPTSRFNVWVRVEFPEAVGKRFGAIVESLGDAPAPLVVERAMYSDMPGQRRVSWANGTNALAVKLR